MKNKLGRPFLPKKEVRSVLIAVKVSPDEAKRIDKAAKRDNQSRPEWVRTKLLSATDL